MIRTVIWSLLRSQESAPSLNLVKGLQLGNGNEDDDSLLSTTNVDLLSSRDLEGSEFGFKLGNIVLQVDESLSNVNFDALDSGAGGSGGAGDFGGYLCRHNGLKISSPERSADVEIFESVEEREQAPKVSSEFRIFTSLSMTEISQSSWKHYRVR